MMPIPSRSVAMVPPWFVGVRWLGTHNAGSIDDLLAVNSGCHGVSGVSSSPLPPRSSLFRHVVLHQKAVHVELEPGGPVDVVPDCRARVVRVLEPVLAEGVVGFPEVPGSVVERL